MEYIGNCHSCQNGGVKEYFPNKGVVNSDMIAICYCEKGHKTVIDLRNSEFFELLYVSALDALSKGCHIESVLSFHASLESTYKFFVDVIFVKNQIPENTILKFWKKMKLSERRLGVFSAHYLSVTGEVFVTNEVEKLSKFRNDVVHEGNFKSREEVIEYARKTTNIQMEILKVLVEKYSDVFRSLIIRRLSRPEDSLEKHIKDEPKRFHVKIGRASIFQHTQDFDVTATFDSMYEKFIKSKESGKVHYFS